MCKFILSSGVVTAAGTPLLVAGWANERWMPALTGILFAPLLLLSVATLAQLPPPDARDEAERAPRTPMDAVARRRFFCAHAAGLVALIGVYVLLTGFRDFCDNFAAEIWRELGFAGEVGIFAWSELSVAAVSLVALALLSSVRDNRCGVLWSLVLVAAGLVVMGLATAAFQLAPAEADGADYCCRRLTFVAPVPLRRWTSTHPRSGADADAVRLLSDLHHAPPGGFAGEPQARPPPLSLGRTEPSAQETKTQRQRRRSRPAASGGGKRALVPVAGTLRAAE